MPRLRDHREDLEALVARASDHLAMPPVFVEKDYWVTELLRSVAIPVDGASVVFKGGTSLSKAIGAIRRFSEDVDVLIEMEDEGSSSSSIDRILKAIGARAALDLDLEEQRERSGRGVHRTTSYAYDPIVDPGSIRNAVMLEMGTSGGTQPSTQHELRSFIARTVLELGIDAEFDELEPVLIRVLAPERTLLEKLALLHSLAVRYPATVDEMPRHGRHLYDVYCLLAREDIRTALKETDVPRLCDGIREVSLREWEDATERPGAGFAESPAFDPRADCAASLDAAYALIDNLLFEAKPPISAVRDIVKANAALL